MTVNGSSFLPSVATALSPLPGALALRGASSGATEKKNGSWTCKKSKILFMLDLTVLQGTSEDTTLDFFSQRLVYYNLTSPSPLLWVFMVLSLS